MSLRIQKSFQGGDDKGKLYLVATPIGNLEDMTYRAVRTLQEVQWIAAEDTRQTRKLLTHFQIAGRLVSYHEHNKHASGQELIRRLQEGDSVALVSDAGLPAISDPGYDLVRSAAEHDIAVVPIPGANAALSALIVSGLATDRFTFIGFPARDKKELQKQLIELKSASETLIFYESPHRVEKTIKHMLEQWGDRRIALVRELTKKYEEVARGTLEDAAAYLAERPPLGEYCLVVEGNADREAGAQDKLWWERLSTGEHVDHYMQLGDDRKEAMKKTAADRGVSKRDIYNELLT